jgi:hypothetical protein
MNINIRFTDGISLPPLPTHCTYCGRPLEKATEWKAMTYRRFRCPKFISADKDASWHTNMPAPTESFFDPISGAKK